MNSVLLNYKLKDMDDCGLFDYLDRSLTEATKRGYKTLIIAHIPYGVASYDCKEYLNLTKQEQWLALLRKHAGGINGVFFGHTHRSELKSFLGEMPALIGPAISPLFGNSPGFRVVDYDVDSQTLMDYTDYFMNLVDSSSTGASRWTAGFSARELFGIPDISPDSLRKMNASIWESTQAYSKYAVAASGVFDPSYRTIECVMTAETKEQAQACVNTAF